MGECHGSDVPIHIEEDGFIDFLEAQFRMVGEDVLVHVVDHSIGEVYVGEVQLQSLVILFALAKPHHLQE